MITLSDQHGGDSKATSKSRRRKARIEAQTPVVQAAEVVRERAVFTPEATTPWLEQASAAIPQKAGAELGEAGRKLEAWLARHYDRQELERLRPLISELVHLAGLLEDLRRELADPGLKVQDRLRLTRSLTQLLASYCRLWKLVGLPTPEWG